MGQTYSCVISNVPVTALQDLFEILAPSDMSLEILSCKIGQSLDEGDAEAEMLAVEMVGGHGTVTSGAGGTAGVEEPHQKNFAAASAVVEINNTTRMVVGSGSLHNVHSEAWNIQVPYLYQPTPEERHWVSPDDRFTVALPVGPADSLSIYATLTWREWG